MSEPAVVPLDSAKRKTKTFGKQLSKSFQKGKEAMRRGLLTPRGARAQEKPPAEGPAGKTTVINSNIPKAPAPTSDLASKTNDVHTASKPMDAGVEYVKATVKATEDSSTPANIVLDPVDDIASPELSGPATPAPTPSDKAVPENPSKLMQAQANPVMEEVEPGVIDDEGAPAEELGFEPPNVRVTVTGVPTDDSKAVVALEASKPVSYIKPEKDSCGTGKKAVVGVLLLAAASVVGFAVKAHAH